MTAGGYRFTEHDAGAFTDEALAQSAALGVALDAELWPGEPPVPPERFIAVERSLPERLRRHVARAWTLDGGLAGEASCRIDPEYDETPDLLPIGVFVHADHRRYGVGARLLERLVDFARADGRTRLSSWTTSRVPAGQAFAEACGARPVSLGHINQLPTRAVDRAQLEHWVEEGPVRAPGYVLIGWDGATPDEHVTGFASLYEVMNDAPLDDLETNDFTFSPARLREWEVLMEAHGGELRTLVARAPDGALAGFHNVSRWHFRPRTVNVEDTAVRREHRGHALGKWLKAAMTLRILDEWPEVTGIRTGNADSNEPMMGINRAMGYVPLVSTTTWELAVFG